MTDCERADIRDLLPDLISGTLPAVDAERVRAHVERCLDCAAELALLQTARAIRPVAPVLDVARIVAALPRPSAIGAVDATTDKSTQPVGTVRSIDLARQAKARAAADRAAPRWASRGVWRAAATIGVMIVGGWSVLIVRSGGITNISAARGDSTQLTDAPGVVTPVTAPVPSVISDSTRVSASKLGAQHVAVSFGGLTDYTDDELQAVLDRLDKWDGATSTETTTTTPILPVKGGGSLE